MFLFIKSIINEIPKKNIIIEASIITFFIIILELAVIMHSFTSLTEYVIGINGDIAWKALGTVSIGKVPPLAASCNTKNSILKNLPTSLK